MTRPDGVEVRAAGGVVWRGGPDGVEVLVVHRPRYDDWSLPKGKCEPGETDEECALREVAEEAGLTCTTGSELATTRYRDRKDRAKRVRYWSMTVTGGEFAVNDEVDEVRWLPLAAVAAALSYPRDATVVAGLAPPPG